MRYSRTIMGPIEIKEMYILFYQSYSQIVIKERGYATILFLYQSDIVLSLCNGKCIWKWERVWGLCFDLSPASGLGLVIGVNHACIVVQFLCVFIAQLHDSHSYSLILH